MSDNYNHYIITIEFITTISIIMGMRLILSTQDFNGSYTITLEEFTYEEFLTQLATDEKEVAELFIDKPNRFKQEPYRRKLFIMQIYCLASRVLAGIYKIVEKKLLIMPNYAVYYRYETANNTTK